MFYTHIFNHMHHYVSRLKQEYYYVILACSQFIISKCMYINMLCIIIGLVGCGVSEVLSE